MFWCVFAAGRGGWVWERKYEVDSGAYFMNLLWNFYNTPGLFNGKQLLMDSRIHDAVMLLLQVRPVVVDI